MIKKSLLIASLLTFLSGCQTGYQDDTMQLKLKGEWKIESVMGQPVIDYSPAQLNFAADDHLSGNNSCNNFFGKYQVDGNKVQLIPGGHTMKACVDALMAQEQLVNQAMPLVTTGKMKDGLLELKGEDGKVLFTLTKM